jgi:tetratricopeptide (TPR) repeat protein
LRGFGGAHLRLVFAALAAGLLAGQQTSSDALQQYFQQGQQAIAENRYAEASQALEKARELAPEIAEIHATLGFSYFQQGRFGEAVPVLQKALELKPGLPNLDLLLAASLSELGRFREAAPGLETAFPKASDPALKRLAGLQLQRVYSGLGRDREAAAVALEMTKLYPEDPEVLYHAERLFGNLAFLTAQKLSRTAPDSIWTKQAAGEAYEADGQLERAISEYRGVLELDPHRRGIHFRLGRAVLRQSESRDSVDQAAKEFELELRGDPTNANAAYEIGEIYRTQGQFEQAHKYFEQAVEHYPGFEQAQLALGGVLTKLGKPTIAIAHLRTAIALNAKSQVAYYRLAQAHRALGETAEMKEALAQFQRLRSEQSARTAAGASNEEVTAQQVEVESEP